MKSAAERTVPLCLTGPAVELAGPPTPMPADSWARLAYLVSSGERLLALSPDEAAWAHGAVGYARARGRHEIAGAPSPDLAPLQAEATRLFSWDARRLAWLSAVLALAVQAGRDER